LFFLSPFVLASVENQQFNVIKNQDILSFIARTVPNHHTSWVEKDIKTFEKLQQRVKPMDMKDKVDEWLVVMKSTDPDTPQNRMYNSEAVLGIHHKPTKSLSDDAGRVDLDADMTN
jgi:hypothetical protein